MNAAGQQEIYITQGFISAMHKAKSKPATRGQRLHRYLNRCSHHSEEVQIWTDIDGIHNNDPRFVDKTKKIENLLSRSS